MNIVIIEDEILTAEDLRETLLELDEEITIIKVLPSVQQAIDFFKKNAKPLISYEIARYLTLGCKYDPTKSITVLKCEFKGLKRELEDSVEWFIRNGYVNRSSRIRYYKKIGKLK